jgi:hypothetical protein
MFADGPEIEKILAVELGKYDNPVLVFASGRRMSLNKTNTSTLIKEFGTTDSSKWVGQAVQLSAGTIPYDGTNKSAVLVRAAPSLVPAPGPAVMVDDEAPFE